MTPTKNERLLRVLLRAFERVAECSAVTVPRRRARRELGEALAAIADGRLEITGEAPVRVDEAGKRAGLDAWCRYTGGNRETSPS